MKTTLGKEITVTTAFRLPLTDYQQAHIMAVDEGVRLSVIMRRLVAAGLAACEQKGKDAIQEVPPVHPL